MKRKLEGLVAIVTGSGANIGEAIVSAMAAEGAAVVVADINIDGANKVAADINSQGGQALAHHVDLLDESSVKALIEATVSRFGRIDILHNNAADTRPAQLAADAAITDLDTSIWDSAFDVNARGVMLMTKHCIPEMLKIGGGSIINTSSGISILGDVFTPAYAASKGAVNSFTRNTAAQYGKHNIRCNAILPGSIMTPLSRSFLTEEHRDMLKKHTLLPRLGEPKDIAKAAVFLASDDSSFVTGQLFCVDGGACMHQAHVGDVLTQTA